MILTAATRAAASVRSSERAVSFLRDRQKPWGEFAAFRFNNSALEGSGGFDSSPFTTTFVLHALRFIEHPAVAEMCRVAQSFLLEECESPGVWRYWTSQQGVEIDPDLDDTCCASFALWGMQRADSRQTSNIGCILNNRHESGLFKTWLRDAGMSNDIDGAVNANVLLYLGERPETIAARDILVSAINQDREHLATWYYPDPLALYYAVSRAFFYGVSGFSTCRDAIRRKTCDRLAVGDCSSLSIALALCTWMNYGEPDLCEEALARLLQAQLPDGSWERSAFYTGPEPPGPHQVWWGSEELTTAFCLEAISRFRRAGI